MNEQVKGNRRLDALRELYDGDLMGGLDYVANHLSNKSEGDTGVSLKAAGESTLESTTDAPVASETVATDIVSIIIADSNGVEHEYNAGEGVSEAELRAYVDSNVQSVDENNEPFAPRPRFGKGEQLPGVHYPSVPLHNRFIDGVYAMSRGRKALAIGAGAIMLASGFIAGPKFLSNNEESSLSEEAGSAQSPMKQTTAIDLELFEACTDDHSFVDRFFEQTYSVTAGVEWTLPNGHKYGPDLDRVISMVTVPQGRLQSTLCDSDESVTVEGDKVTVDLGEVTVLTQIISGEGDLKTRFVPPVNDEYLAPEDRRDDIEQVKQYSKETPVDVLQSLVFREVKEYLERQPDTFRDDALTRANDAVQAAIEERVKELASDRDYAITTKGEIATFKVLPPRFDVPEYLSIDQADIAVGKQ